MKVVILAGGYGTRISEESHLKPKPMIDIGDKPILWHIMKIYAACGFTDFVLCLGYKGDMIKDFFRNYLWLTSQVTLRLGRDANVKFHNHHSEEDWTVTLADTGEDTMTAGRIRRIRQFIGDDPEFFLTYGDGVADVDIAALTAFHRKQGLAATLTAVLPPGRFGSLAVEGLGPILSGCQPRQAFEDQAEALQVMKAASPRNVAEPHLLGLLQQPFGLPGADLGDVLVRGAAKVLAEAVFQQPAGTGDMAEHVLHADPFRGVFADEERRPPRVGILGRQQFR